MAHHHLLMQYNNKEIFEGLVKTQMPYGKYKETLLCNIPMHYLEWMKRKGFPNGKLGVQLQTIYEIKLNGLEHLLEPIKQVLKQSNKIHEKSNQ